ncbi:hypothetical protein BJY04DRAFT_232283 [Aspergillus karnatakaensis]|uniref:Zn(II)2Cys6 transcription factor n=1 Tax=Aspergillus karnatakaensis TaxID=1810916 RepID=UPI003CCCBB26
MVGDNRKEKEKVQRTRTGCHTCRARKVKCDEHRPKCGQCQRGNRPCTWPGLQDATKMRQSRRPNSTACQFCREKKLKCVGDVGKSCVKCVDLGIKCVRTGIDAGALSPSAALGEGSIRQLNSENTTPTMTSNDLDLTDEALPTRLPAGQLPEHTELVGLIDLYFSSVHHFGFFAFIHPIHFQRLLAEQKAPRDLTLMMIASAMRFAAPATPENLAKANVWADTAIASLFSRIYQGFGAIQLMSMLLAQHYELNRGNFTSSWILSGNCTRMMQMMSLHTFDRTYPAHFPSQHRLSPLLSREALRRVAWCTFYLDSMIDGGRYGSHTTDERSYRLQLPCDEQSFLANDMVVTEPLLPREYHDPISDSVPAAPLDMFAYLLRTAAARRRALHFAFRASHQEQSLEKLSAGLIDLQSDIEGVVAALPRRFQYTAENMFLHRDRRITFITLHVLRHNLFIILGRAALLIHPRDLTKLELVVQARRSRIAHALAIASLVAEGLKSNTTFDPHIGIQSYVALEILLFEPRRLAQVDPSIEPAAPELMEAITHLLTAIRAITKRSEFTRILVCHDPAEYDFRDFRGAKLERLSKQMGRANIPPTDDEILLEDPSNKDSIDPSTPLPRRLDAIDVNALSANSLNSNAEVPGSSILSDAPRNLNRGDHGLTGDGQQWKDLIEPDNADHVFSSLNWIWPFEELDDGMLDLPDIPEPF